MDLTPEQIEGVRENALMYCGSNVPTAHINALCDMALQTAAAHARITRLEQALRELVDENLLDNAEQAKRVGMGHVTACLSLRWIESARQAVAAKENDLAKKKADQV
jgi:hypothetical protein